MLGKRSRLSTIGKLAGALRSSGIVESVTSPRSPLDCGMQSPRGQKNFDQQGGVGLGIIVSLTNTNNNNNNNNNNTSKSGGEILAKYALCIKKGKECGATDNAKEEDFTYVTSHATEKSITTRVYCPTINQSIGVFDISSSPSPARLFDDSYRSSDYDFLSSCQLCRKTLHGKDIYMYKGEKAFCSEECRQRQIGIDERKEKCRSKASRSSNVSSSPYSYTSRGGKLFSAGIVAV